MRPVLVLALLTAAAILPARAGTVYVPYAADEQVGSARYRTEIAAANRGGSPARVEALFVSADGVKYPRLTAIVPAGGSASLASAVPAGAHGRLEVMAPTGMEFTARLVAYGHDGHLLSSAEEPVVPAGELLYPGQPRYLQNLANSADTITRLGVIMADDRGSCSLTAFGYLASDTQELGTARGTGAAAVARIFAEPLKALRATSLIGAWFTVACDTPALPYATVLATDGRRTSFFIAHLDSPLEQEVPIDPNLTKKQIDQISVGHDPAPTVPKDEPAKRPSPAPTSDRPPPPSRREAGLP